MFVCVCARARCTRAIERHKALLRDHICVSERVHYVSDDAYDSFKSHLCCFALDECARVCVCVQLHIITRGPRRASSRMRLYLKSAFEVFRHQTCKASCAQLGSLFESPSSHGFLPTRPPPPPSPPSHSRGVCLPLHHSVLPSLHLSTLRPKNRARK